MTSFIPEDKISEIKNITDIVDIISEYVHLKKAGKNFIGLCPFHSEKTASFTVSPDKQIFYCFGCGSGGNVFTYIMKQDGLSFPETVKMLAGRYGVEIPTKKMSPDQRRRINEREQLFAVNRTALNYYSGILNNTATGKKALDYLANRGIHRETTNAFQLGYSPAGWDNLLNHFRKMKISPVVVEKCGLIVPKKNNNGYYDRFRDRIIFPILDISTQTIGFGGRVMDDSLPKYLNSPETSLYHKSQSLYGLHLAKRNCRKSETVYVVEGYFDLISMHQHGISNSVATLGTSLTLEHVRILRGFIGKSGRVILVYDSDDAGIKAAKRSITVFEKGFADAKILVLEKDYDPDSYLVEFGTEAFMDAVSKSMGVIDFLIDSAIKKHGLSVDGKIRIISDLKKPMTLLGDSVERSLYIKELSEKIEINEDAILEKIRKESTDDSIGIRKGSIPEQFQKGIKRQEPGNRMERRIIVMMLQYPESIAEIQKRNALEFFEEGALKKIGNHIIEYFRKPGRSGFKSDTDKPSVNKHVNGIMNSVDDEADRRIIAGLSIEDDIWEINGCIKLITQFVEFNQKHRNGAFIEKQIKEAEKNNNQELLQRLLIEKQTMAVLKEKQKMALLEKH